MVLRLTGRTSVAVLCGALALIGGGCGSPSHRASAHAPSAAEAARTAQLIAKAAIASSAAPGFKLALTQAVSGTAVSAGGIIASGTGSFSTTRGTGALSFTSHLGATPDEAAALGGPSLNIQELVDGTTLYLKFPRGLTGKSGATKPWARVDLLRGAGAAAIPGISTLLESPAASQPGVLLQTLRAIAGGARKLGTARVGGYQTTEYRTTIQLNRYPGLVAPAQRAPAEQAVQALAMQFRASEVPVTVYVDGQNLVRRMEFSRTATTVTSGTYSTHSTADFTEYGPQPAPRFPPAGQVSDVSSVFGR